MTSSASRGPRGRTRSDITPTSALARTRIAALLGAGTLLLTGCAGGAPADQAGAAGTGTSVVVSLYPVQFLAEAIGGEDAEVSNVVPAGAEPHDIELGPRDVFAMGAANLVVTVSGFQPAVDAAAEESENVLDLAPTVELIDRDGTRDPHFWLDPARMIAATDDIAAALSSTDPGNEDGYHERAAAVREDLDELDAAFLDRLGECAYDSFVTGHAAFGYLADAYGLTEIAIAGIDPETEPSPAALASVREEIADLGLPIVFAEPGETKIAQVLADELDIEHGVLNPIETVSGGEDYLTLMYENLEALEGGLQCR